MTNKTTSAIDLVERPCDVCGKSLKAHQYGAGVPICPGIYAPGYRSRLNDKIAEQSDTITRLQAALTDAADELESCAEQFRALNMTTCAQYAEAQMTKARASVGEE